MVIIKDYGVVKACSLNFKWRARKCWFPESCYRVWEISQRLDKNTCMWEQYKKYTLCVQDPWIRGPGSSRWLILCTGLNSGRYPASISVAFIGLEDGLGPHGGQEEVDLAAGLPFNPRLGENEDTGLLFLGPFSPPLPFSIFSSMFVLKDDHSYKVLGSSRYSNKRDTPDRCIRYCFVSSLHKIGAVPPPVWEKCSDTVFGLNQNN